jgi:hypothetical protein
VQSLEEEHDTPSSSPSGPVRGVASTDQLVPFQSSANGTFEVPLDVAPTAMQSASVVHDTLRRLTMSPERATGAWLIDHAVPFHVSMSEASWALSTPTAAQNVALVHDTPESWLKLVALTGTAVSVAVDMLVPFHVSTSGAPESSRVPTAAQKVLLTHETPFRKSLLANGSVISVHPVSLYSSITP